ncbi:TPA: ABC transporter permease [Citrobacter farmeri]|uniref:ABC transporter permease n=2 Tax=Citrobacter farmeri TaxID=67824 RepID=A0A8H9NUZ9_9ENTR|nr:ABC transporter permease [Citrobacter farmeri]HAT2167496.1 ABC transporter permease [Citrobacter freundii]AST81354.1 ABC transporter permease [Citrobacter farmeri]EMB4691677.1 ABC transporter permease [Citrobacter farmeri]MCP1691966.1 peptide/nickel transport system permease protein [Citrobacter farmeri]MCW2421766.1 peptide/nickel transport system permease protein [Citrobacter farmeri]
MNLPRNPALLIWPAVLVAIVLLSFFASLVSPYDPYSIDPLSRLKPPSVEHWFGTDNFGRDLFVRVALAVRVSLSVGAAVAVIAGVTGIVIGLLCAWYRPVDRVLMRVCDGLFAFPSLLLAIAIVGVLGPNIANVVLALSLVYVPSIARVIRGAAMVIKEKNFIEALRAQGASASRIIWLHLLPNVISPFIVQVSWVFSVAILTEAALSFLGSGVPAPMPSLGNLLLEGKTVIFNAWWMTFFPGIAIVLLILGLNIIGDDLRDNTDPNLKPLPRRVLRRLKQGGRYG